MPKWLMVPPLKERPILFSGPMVRAILDGRKTQTRRVAKPQPIPDNRFVGNHYLPVLKRNLSRQAASTDQAINSPLIHECCPYGQPGDRLWVREAWGIAGHMAHDHGYVEYRANCEDGSKFNSVGDPVDRWVPSIHMPRRYSRITLELTDVQAEHLQDITPEAIIAEGAVVRWHDDQFGHNPISAFDGKCYMDLRSLWAAGFEGINGKGTWSANPWVWVLTFKPMPQAAG